VGRVDPVVPVTGERSVKYHSWATGILTWGVHPWGHGEAGSLAGAASSQRVTEEHKGQLSTVGNRALSARAQAGSTARLISRAVAKAGSSDPVVPHGRAIAQQIKGTPGITG
jgi:hypothetical protein